MGTKVETDRLLQGHNSFLTPFFCKSQAAQRHSPKRPKHSEHLVLAAPAEKRVRKPNKNDEKRVLLQENGCEKVCSMYVYIYDIYIYDMYYYVLIYFTKKKGSKAVFLIDELLIARLIVHSGAEGRHMALQERPRLPLSPWPPWHMEMETHHTRATRAEKP
jgi:hypothetical protein